MNKEFIPYEQALELRYLGFDEECMAYWTSGLNGYYIEYKHYTNEHWMFTANDNKDRDKMCTAPLYQQAFRWFREKYKCTYEIIIREESTITEYIAWVSIFNNNKIQKICAINYSDSTHTYEEAELACLKKLIEIVKNK